MVDTNGEDDHVHLLVEYPPKVTFSTLVNSLKGVSSRRLGQVHPDVTARYWRGRPVVPELFCGILWGGSALDHQDVYRESAEAPLRLLLRCSNACSSPA